MRTGQTDRQKSWASVAVLALMNQHVHTPYQSVGSVQKRKKGSFVSTGGVWLMSSGGSLGTGYLGRGNGSLRRCFLYTVNIHT